MRLIISLFIFSMLLLIGMMQPQIQMYKWEEPQNSRNNLNGQYMSMNILNENTPDYINYAGSFIHIDQSWLPIGHSSNLFTGTFNVRWHTLSDLYKKRRYINYLPLFGSTDSSKTDSITLTGAYRSGKWGAESYVFRGVVDDF